MAKMSKERLAQYRELDRVAFDFLRLYIIDAHIFRFPHGRLGQFLKLKRRSVDARSD